MRGSDALVSGTIGFAKLRNRKTLIIAADLLNDLVIPSTMPMS
jgi:hypothetical protein